MKAKSHKNYYIAAAAFAASLILFAAFAVIAASTAAIADSAVNYYVCYATDDYRVRAANVMTKDGDVYELSPTLSRGDKFYVSDGAGNMYGDKNGEPMTVTENGKHKYTVAFDPSADGGKVSYKEYSPETVTLVVKGGGEEMRTVEMTYRRANVAFEEYVVTVYSLFAGDIVTVTDESGKEYGYKKQEPQDGEAGAPDVYTVPKSGDYRFTFTKDDDNLYDGKNYMTAADVPTLYVLCEENGYNAGASDIENYRMTRNEDNTAFEEYEFSYINVPEKDYELGYSVFDASADKSYEPSGDGKIEVKDKGKYKVSYSPDHVYSASGDNEFNVAIERVKEYYDGYYVLGDFNGYLYIESDEFDSKYKLIKDESVRDYDEYRLDLYITSDMLGEFDGEVEFYITDGANIYRRPITGADIKIDRAGKYEIYFSPTHDYGRGYRYRLARAGDEIVAQTVYIETADELVEFLKNCTSPEYSLNKRVVIKNDIDLSGKTVTPAAVFSGELDGLYNRITGFSYESDNSAYLIREVTADGEVKRLDLDVKIKGGDNVAPICYNMGRVGELKVYGAVEGEEFVGGIVASNYAGGETENCESYVTVTGILNVGGIVGFNGGNIYDCVNRGDVDNKVFDSSDARKMLNVGGVAGYSTGNVFGSKNYGNVGLDQARYFGGIVGLSSGGLYFCENYGVVGAENYAGGVVGYYGRFDSNNGGGTLPDEIAAWLEEYLGSDGADFEEAEDTGVRDIYYCYNAANIKAEDYAGGICGYADAAGLTVFACVSSGNITAKDSYVGGIGGAFGAGAVTQCAASGNVIAERGSHAGGIAGRSTGIIEYCVSACYAESETSYAGGIVGEGNTVNGCVAHAFVTKGDGEYFGIIAGSATAYNNNFYRKTTANDVKGINGADYGSESDYGAAALEEEDIVSLGTLSPELYGLDPEKFSAGENEKRYPVPRAFIDVEKPERYAETARFESAFEAATAVRSAAEELGKTTVTVTFYEWDFDADKYVRYDGMYIVKGSGVTPPEVPTKDGYFTEWDRNDFSAFESDTSVFMLYDKYATTLASDGTSAPLVMVTGKFYSDTTLLLDYTGEYIGITFDRAGVAFEYDYDMLSVRVKANEGDSVKIISGGEIKDAAAKLDGGYLIFDLPYNAQFTLVPKPDADLAVLYICLAAAVSAIVVAGVFLTVILVRKKKHVPCEPD